MTHKFPIKAPVILDRIGRWKFYGVPRSGELPNAAWYIVVPVTERLKFFGGYNTVWYADMQGQIRWIPLELKTRQIYIPYTTTSELIWLEEIPNYLLTS
jgi:hypothetical protein